MLRFRTTITLAVMAFIAALAALLILIQTRTFNLTTEQAASGYMENANENDNGDRGKQARQFPRQGFSPNFLVPHATIGRSV